MVSNDMQAPSPAFPVVLRAIIAGCLLGLAIPLHAGEGGFVATLSVDQQAAAGLPSLSAAERAALDQLVAGELAQARQGELRELAGSFASRRAEVERRSAGLDRLTPAELTKLNDLVAAALAARPKPKERPRIKDAEILVAAPRPEIHGEVAVTFGWGGAGRTFRASSLWLNYFDPVSGLGLGIGLSNISGNGFYGFYPDYFGSGYYGLEPAFLETSFRNAPQDDPGYGTGQSFCAPSTGDFSGRGRHRR